MTYEAEDNVGLGKVNEDLKNAYYQLKIERDGQSIYALDPYAKSMAVWDGLS